MLARRPVLSELITHRFPLERATEAFRVAADRKMGSIKVVLEPHASVAARDAGAANGL
jgi:threonine dehydrogenase-like Zn-dependent dehydrogenase